MTNFYQILNKAEVLEIRLYGDIAMDEWGKWTPDDTCPSDIVQALKDAGEKPLTIRINSGGGSVFGGIAIYNVLKQYPGHKTVYVDGIAASIASVIMLAGDDIRVPKNAAVMMHEPWAIAAGTAKELASAAESLGVCWNVILSVYAEHLADGVTIDALRDEITDKGELWMDGEKAAEYFVLNLLPEVKAVACLGKSLDQWKWTPEGIPRARAEPEAGLMAETLYLDGAEISTITLDAGELAEHTIRVPEQADSVEDALNMVSAFCFVEKETMEHE